MAQWKTCTISDIGTVVGGATPSTKKAENYEGGQIAWITPKDLSTFKGRYISRGERNITEIGLNSCSTQLMPPNTVLFSSRAPIGYVAIAQNEVCTNQGFKSIIPNKDIEPLFLFYLLKYNKDKIENMGSGTTFKEVSGNTMKGIEVKVPCLFKEQKKIASILGLLDDKIEENERINDNLEEQAQTIFNAWFIDFEPFSGIMPEDWEIITLGDVTINNREKIGNTICPVFSAINTGHLVLSDDYFTKQVYSKNIQKYIRINEWDFAYNPARINIGSIGINDLGFSGCVSPVYVTFSVEKEYQSFFRFYFKSKKFSEETKLRASGSVRQTLNYYDFALIEIIYPNHNIALKFDELWKSYYTVITKIKKENKRLIEIRDTLLTKLMSGELDVSDIDI